MKKQLFMLGVVLAAVCATLAWAFDAPDAKMEVARPLSESKQQPTVKKAAEHIPKAALPEPSVGVSIGTIDAILYSESGLHINSFHSANVKYVAQTAENTYMGFQIHESYGEVPEEYMASFEAVQSSDCIVTIPDSIRVNDMTIPVTYVNYACYLGSTIKESNISTITFPSTILYFNANLSIGGIIKVELENIYMLCSSPEVDFTYANNVYVCNKKHYLGYLDNESFSAAQITPYGWDFEWVTVKVEKPGEFAQTYLTQNDYDWDAEQWVKVTGNINSIDLGAMKNLGNLIKLDLSETEITEIPATFLDEKYYLNEIILPETVTSIGDYAFQDCIRLNTIEMPGVRNIGIYAFNYCKDLEHLDLSSVKTIGDYAFYRCKSINDIDCPSIETIGSVAFNYCENLRIVKFGHGLKSLGHNAFSGSGIEALELQEGVTTIPHSAFSNCKNLSSIKLPKSVSEIDYDAFSNCTSLTDVDLQDGLKKIKERAFSNCTSLGKIVIPSTVNYIGANVFSNTAITEFVCNAVMPPVADNKFIGNNMDMSHTYLFVPLISKDFYRNANNWSDFYLIEPILDPIDCIRVDRPLAINLMEQYDYVVAGNPELYLSWVDNNNIGQLTVTGDGTLSAGHMTVSSLMTNRNNYRTSNNIPTLINYVDKIRADVVNNYISFYGARWHFMSLPYDAKVSEIVPDDDTYWVIRKYDSAARAAGEFSQTWVNLKADDVLEAGKGYIVSVAGNSTYAGLTFTSGNSATKDNIFRTDDVTVPLSEYASEFAHNRSWNLMGNPYPCYFDMHFLNEEFTAPVTIWNGSAYVAYSPVDDDLVLAPYEAFFVQCPPDTKEMTFKESGRMHSNQGKPSYKAPSMADAEVSAEGRNVFNFNVSGMDSEDRARIVLNPEAAMTYEVGRDASKFFAESGDGIELYVVSNALYSIDERPVGDGSATLGVKVAKDGEYTISLDGRHSAEWSVILTDNVTGHVVDLTKEDYIFEANKGETPDRFSVQFRIGASGVEGIAAEFGKDSIVTVTAANGIIVYTGRMADMNVGAAGLYIISDGKESRKAILK